VEPKQYVGYLVFPDNNLAYLFYSYIQGSRDVTKIKYDSKSSSYSVMAFHVRCASTEVTQKYHPVFISLSLRHHSCGRFPVWYSHSYQFTVILALVHFALFFLGGGGGFRGDVVG